MTGGAIRQSRIGRRGRAALTPIAIASLYLLPTALAETDITATQTTPIKTSNAGDIVIESGGEVNPTSGAAITLDSNNSVTVIGSITISEANKDGDATGILVNGGFTGTIAVSGTINVTDATIENTVPLTSASNRYGIDVTGTTPFDGSIEETAGTIEARGNNSAAILVTPGLTGEINIVGAVGVTGEDSYGIETLGAVKNITISGTVVSTGANSSALYIGGAVNEAIDIDGTIRSTGYFMDAVAVTTRPTDDTVLASATGTNLGQSAAAVQILNNVTGGIVIDTDGIVSSYGSAPALLIGPTSGSTVVGVYDAADYTEGLRIAGIVRSSGIFDKFDATALQVGGTGGSVTIDGGIAVASTGRVAAQAYAANATGMSIASGATVPSLVNAGTIRADVAFGANGNAATGGNATAIIDNSGSLGSITNTGTISAITASGTATAINVSANTTGITITQSASGTSTPSSITGDILFGSGNATLNLESGTINGNVSFGTGDNTLTITGGGVLTGALTTAGANTAVSVQNGLLNLSGLATTNVSTLAIGSSGEVIFTADPTTGQSTKLNALEAVIVSEGAKVGLNFDTRLISPEGFTIIETTPGSLAGQPTLSIGSVSYFYVANIVTDNAAGTVSIDVRDRSFAESGVQGNAAAYNAIAGAVGNDQSIFQAFNGATTRKTFSSLYGQMLPFYSGGLFEVMQEGSAAVIRAQEDAPIALGGNHDGFWFQALGFGGEKGSDESPGYYGGGLGLAFGWEEPESPISALGVTFSYNRGSITQTGQGSDSQETGSVYSGGVYWRENDGNFRLNASLNAGIGQFNSIRNFEGADATDTAFTRSASANWVGGSGQAHIGLGYELPLTDHFYIRPETKADYFVLYEDAHQEHNGGNAFDLKIASGLGKQGSVEGDLTVGAHYDDDSFIWKPELTVGWKQVFGGPDDTMAQFSMGSQFTLSPKAQEGGALARLGIHGGDKYTDIAFEAGGEDRGPVKTFDGQLVARMKF